MEAREDISENELEINQLPEEPGDDPESTSEEAVDPSDSQPTDSEAQGIIEALIFSANDPVDASKLCKVFAEVSGGDTIKSAEVYEIVKSLNDQYASSGRAFRIFEWAGGFRLATQPEYAPYVKSLHEIDSQRKLSRSLIETLAIVAYKQPVTKPEIDFVRGVDSDYAVRRLMELDLVDVIGRSESVGKPLLYGTTKDFLEKFGLNDIESLPSLREIEDLLDDPAFNRERAELLMSKGLTLDPEGEAEAGGEAAGEDAVTAEVADTTSESSTQVDSDTITVDRPATVEKAEGPARSGMNKNGASGDDGPDK